MKRLKVTDNQLFIIAGALTLPAYFLINKFYKLQLVYGEAHLSKATLAWLMLLLAWGPLSDRLSKGDKRKGWMIYFAGIIPLSVYVLA